MSKKNFKLLLRVIIALLCLAIVIIIFKNKIKKDTGLDGNEWFARQYEYMNQFTSYCLSMDQVYALYIAEDMTTSNFLIEYALLLNQWEVLEASYSRYLKENPVKPNGHTYVSKRGEEAITDLRYTIKNILDKTKNGNSVLSQKELLYMYLSFKQDIQMALAEYSVAYQWIIDSELSENDYEQMVIKYKDYFEAEMSELEPEEETSGSINITDK